jgi:SNF family Na+-dependent transporter
MSEQERWATRVGLVLAMAGNAVGLGNFLRFPVQAAQNGGGTFMIPYFISFLLLGIPMMWVEWAIGRYGGGHGHSSTPGMFERIWDHPLSKYLGALGLFMPLTVMVYYTYVESWSLGYSLFTATGAYWGNETFEGMSAFLAGYQGIEANQYFGGIAWAYGLFIVTLAINVYVLSRGVSGGIELVARYALPALFIFAIILVGRVLLLGTPDPSQPQFSVDAGLGFIWNPDFGQITNARVWLAAAGQIFFTLSLGMGTLQCYASYLTDNDDIALTGLATTATNEFAEVVLGGTLAIPAAVVFFGLERTQELARNSYDMAFAVMPALFQQLPGGQLFGTLWFALLFIAGITSSLAMGQPLMAFLQDELKMTRNQAAISVGLIVFVLVQPVIFFMPHFMNEFDFWAGTFGLVVLAAIELVLFTWVFGIHRAWDEINKAADIQIPIVFKYVLQFVTPLMLFVILGSYFYETLPGVLRLDGVDPEAVPWIMRSRLMLLGMLVGVMAIVGYAWRRHGGTGRRSRPVQEAA